MKNIFTNGCFDILHPGHISLLKYCKSLGDKVTIGLNSDRSVKILKGPTRPVNCQEDRKIMLESIRYVDEVIIFDEVTPYDLIKQVLPDIIVKGSDYTNRKVVGEDLCEVKLFDYEERYSTTKIIQSITNR
jgi:D-beta-D-heptose 7-phosphate kinase / D-beta-D-heptose 1-phosphate adenosyltransferase